MTSYNEMPSPLPIRACTFDLMPFQEVTPVGGFIRSLDRNIPLWAATYETVPLRGTRYNDMQAFLDSLEGSKGSFLGYDAKRPVPYAYKHLPIGSTPWGANPKVTEGNYANSTLSLQFSNPITLTKGDYVSFIFGFGWRLYRCQETKQGATIVIKVKPRPMTFALAMDVRLIRPCAEMKLFGSRPEWQDSVDSLPSVSFQAIQHIARAL